MLFSFAFSGDDFSDSESACGPVATPPQAPPNKQPQLVALPPKAHRLEDLLLSLANVRLSFDNHHTPGGNLVYRRQLFDIKHQVMTEEGEDANEVHSILIGNSSDEVDVRKNVYEGGFKLWECSYDLVDRLHTLHESGEIQAFRSVLELGCGTALPTCHLLLLLFAAPSHSQQSTFVFSDFNLEVLRLVTLPNILVHYASTLAEDVLNGLMDSEIPLGNDEILLTPALLAKFVSALREKNLELHFISGSWGEEFVQLVSPYSPDLIVTSETIYSPESLPLVLSMLVDLLADKQTYLGLVAAKQYYFGVGGSVKEFLDDLSSKKPSSMAVDATSDNLGQLKREILLLYPSK
ncbi:hypothetical protein METBIDRAFT_35902 [Metschnikowia bicuspidata var. bicuspidata NRRL YB-4993]|uniref:protein-histidine N-methyltransferase n=1 Tax=Metschnikowia bicuspidata var. bicuspidata NRRL YB-4993 TaxID=869754 RepID=A0A1A0HKV1_9ASCO|nr:hypothetical protein METBIDRAFT_35902 [Metschnikowia bicuspidata var. bicuspidata NRRL YB-4993]OBA24522.1 hypothetical protein METBIDRAFT_35902 [Metschnikowia bicuspidata var. bicuspidata NRRL YB-4993]